ncbi:hypothetical protein CN689_00960 [Peribacillus butanolivorans]|uniref:Uncharacterized protein n=1 Tax=Peribacillus butanolivorans TaxID=421767 RepID=A0AAX0RT54_9BACI|nr:hypothetical protein [Peribacillus butanolivorans]PEJ37503.1 hypothetical protein CN689_00960 [Peribacillus butanolivorans]
MEKIWTQNSLWAAKKDAKSMEYLFKCHVIVVKEIDSQGRETFTIIGNPKDETEVIHCMIDAIVYSLPKKSMRK